jgi:hypothetical protein
MTRLSPTSGGRRSQDSPEANLGRETQSQLARGRETQSTLAQGQPWAGDGHGESRLEGGE